MSDTDDDILIISERLQSVTTIDPAYNNARSQQQQQQQQQQGESSRENNNNAAVRQPADSKKAGAAATTTAATDDYVSVNNVPNLNLPEKILFVIDRVREHEWEPFKLSMGGSLQPLLMIKHVVQNFLHTKFSVQPGVHEYALMTLDSHSASWFCDYTNNIETILNHLEDITEDVLEEKQRTYDLGLPFEVIHRRIATPARSQPTFTSRVILIYGRSYSIPKFHTGKKYLENLTENPYFFLDVLYAHDSPNDYNMCMEVYAKIAGLDTSSSYILEVGRNVGKIHDKMKKLLAQPLQRPLQEDAS